MHSYTYIYPVAYMWAVPAGTGYLGCHPLESNRRNLDGSGLLVVCGTYVVR